jgi:phosphatidylserine decarboxylase
MRIDHNSYGSVAIAWMVGGAIIILFRLLFSNPLTFWILTCLTLLICLWQTLFFRVPVRECPGSGSVVTAVADGKIVINEKVYEPMFLKKECIQVSIYMNFFDVHANFWPVSGEVVNYEYFPGKHFFAYHPKSSLENEHTCTLLRTPDGKQVLFKQIAGGFARRIVNYAQPGMKVTAGEQCGIIKFGSRIDIFFPLDADVRVKEGDLVRACETVLAELS